jgi:hypothetical protein
MKKTIHENACIARSEMAWANPNSPIVLRSEKKKEQQSVARYLLVLNVKGEHITHWCYNSAKERHETDGRVPYEPNGRRPKQH